MLGKLETANRQLEKDVQQEKQLLEERKELVDRLSHEMKTPLGIIRAYAEGIQDETDEGKRQKYSEIILSETERMNDLIIKAAGLKPYRKQLKKCPLFWMPSLFFSVPCGVKTVLSFCHLKFVS